MAYSILFLTSVQFRFPQVFRSPIYILLTVHLAPHNLCCQALMPQPTVTFRCYQHQCASQIVHPFPTSAGKCLGHHWSDQAGKCRSQTQTQLGNPISRHKHYQANTPSCIHMQGLVHGLAVGCWLLAAVIHSLALACGKGPSALQT